MPSVSVPGSVLLLVVGPVLLPDQRAARAGELDPVNVVLSLAAILPFVYGLKELVRDGPSAALLFGNRAFSAAVARASCCSWRSTRRTGHRRARPRPRTWWPRYRSTTAWCC